MFESFKSVQPALGHHVNLIVVQMTVEQWEQVLIFVIYVL